MARPLGGVAKLAVVGVVGSLVLSRVLSVWIDARVPIVALFFVFLVAAFALLAVGVAYSSRATEELAATPRWSLRAAIRRRILTPIGRSVARTAAFIARQVTRAARAARAGIVGLGQSFAPEQRPTTWDAVKRAGRATLVALGMPPDDEARELPNEGLDAMPTLGPDRPSPAETPSAHPDGELEHHE